MITTPPSAAIADDHSYAEANAPKKTSKRVRITFIAECEAEVLANVCTIFGRPGLAEPFLREEFAALCAAFFRGKLLVVQSAVDALTAESSVTERA